MSKTPEPRSPNREIRTPDAPRYGPLFDNYEPYAPRKSSRVAEQARRAELNAADSDLTEIVAPASDNDDPFFVGHVTSHQATAQTTNSTTTAGNVHSSAMDMNNIHSTPATARTRNAMARSSNATPTTTGRMVDLMSPPSTSRTSRRSAVDLLNNGQGDHSKDDTTMGGIASGSRTSMLPTPAKTPSSKTTIEASAIGSVARNLFPRSSVDDAMPNRRRKARAKLDSEIHGEEEPLIEIYTDTKERIPEVDNSPANQFYRSGVVIAPIPGKPPKSSKRRKVANPEPVEASASFAPEGTSGGTIYVFRGKKVLIPDAEQSTGAATEAEAQLDAEIEAELGNDFFPERRTRSSGKHSAVKWLFDKNPRHAREQAEEEEANTDIEDESYHKAAANKSVKTTGAASKIPIPSVIRPTTPERSTPSTHRVTRAHKQARSVTVDLAGDDELDPRVGRTRSRAGATNPFDHWARTRSPLTDPSDLGSPTRKVRPRMTTRSAARTRRCL